MKALNNQEFIEFVHVKQLQDEVMTQVLNDNHIMYYTNNRKTIVNTVYNKMMLEAIYS